MWIGFPGAPLATIFPVAPTATVLAALMSTSAHGSIVRVPTMVVSYGRMCGLVSAVHVSSTMRPACFVGPAVGLGQSVGTGGAASAPGPASTPSAAGGAAGDGAGAVDDTVHARGEIATQAAR